MEYFLLLYVLPVFASTILLYFDEDNITNRDFFNSLGWALFPIFNILSILFLLLELTDKKLKISKMMNKINRNWKSFLDKEIKR